MNEREFRRRNQKQEEARVMERIKEDSDAAKKFEAELGHGIMDLGKLAKSTQVPEPSFGERMLDNSIPVQLGDGKTGGVIDLAAKRLEKQAGQNEIPEHVGNAQYICLDVGYPPPGQPTPTHIKIGNQVFLAIPAEHFDAAVDLAYRRGFHRCLAVYEPQHKAKKVVPAIDPIQKSYKEMVLEGFYD